LEVLRGIDDDGLITREAMKQALGFPNLGQVSQMLNEGIVPGGGRVLNLLNADLPADVRRRVLSLVGGVVDQREAGEAAADTLGGVGAERVRYGLLEGVQVLLGLVPWAVKLERMEDGIEDRPGSTLEWALEAEWATKMGAIKRARAVLDGVGAVCDEIAMRPGRAAARVADEAEQLLES